MLSFFIIKRVFIIVKKSSDSSYLLLISNKKHRPMGLPGGRYDSDDKGPLKTAHRELFEETSLNIEDFSRFKYLGLISNKLFYLLEINDKEADSIKVSHEHIDYLFYRHIELIPELIKDHSGGTSSVAFKQFVIKRV